MSIRSILCHLFGHDYAGTDTWAFCERCGKPMEADISMPDVITGYVRERDIKPMIESLEAELKKLEEK